ncbi:MAG: hypothetical protein NVSMB6_20500 [Burkholderiaceae bacterium]
MISGLLSNSKAKRGVALLQEAAALHDKILDTGVLFSPEAIKNIERPFPAGWSGQQFDGNPKVAYGRVRTVSNSIGAT